MSEKREIDGLLCVTGETPALGYTVAQLIECLQGFPQDAPVGFNVGPDSNLTILSVYQATESPNAVWFDLEESSDSATGEHHGN